MRIARFLTVLVLAQFFGACDRPERGTCIEAVNAYIENNVNNIRYDLRIFDPPPPPEKRDSVGHNGRIRPDSVIRKLRPLRVYVDVEIRYDTLLKGARPVEGFGFVRDIVPGGESLFLDGGSFSKREGIVLEFVTGKDFFAGYEKIRFNDDYGGLTSFRNLYCSGDGKRAVFEISFFIEGLNASTSIVYAEKREDGTWEFTLEMVSIS